MSDNTNFPFGGGLANPAQVIITQFVLTRTDMSTAFTDDEYNACLTALSNNLAVAVNFGINGSLRQAQLASKTGLGALTFSYTRNESVESWTVSASSPHTITHTTYDVDGSITPLLNTGTKIAEGMLGGNLFELYAPSSVEYITPSATPSNVYAIVNSGKLPVMLVVSGQGNNYFYPTWTGSGVTFVHIDEYGVIVKKWDIPTNAWVDSSGYDDTLSSQSTNAVQNSTLYTVIGDVETLLAAL